MLFCIKLIPQSHVSMVSRGICRPQMSAAGALLRGLSLRAVPGPGPRSTGTPRKGLKKQRRRRRFHQGADVVVVKGKVNVLSLSGAVTALGLVIALIGVAMAAIGYWPYSPGPTSTSSVSNINSTNAFHHKSSESAERSFVPSTSNSTSLDPMVSSLTASSSPPTSFSTSRTMTSGNQGVARTFVERQLHTYRMKVLGPLTMGVGIFICICGMAALFENRDKGTKIIHLRDIYSALLDAHSHSNGTTTLQPPPCFGRYSRCYKSECVAPLNSGVSFVTPCSLGENCSSIMDACAGRGLHGCPSALCTISPGCPSQIEHGEKQSAERKRHEARSIVSSSIATFTLPIIKLNNCVIDPNSPAKGPRGLITPSPPSSPMDKCSSTSLEDVDFKIQPTSLPLPSKQVGSSKHRIETRALLGSTASLKGLQIQASPAEDPTDGTLKESLLEERENGAKGMPSQDPGPMLSLAVPREKMRARSSSRPCSSSSSLRERICMTSRSHDSNVGSNEDHNSAPLQHCSSETGL
uniref:transmembrane protein 200A isoform X1 n=2 Tax=Myxine glutinosa TaxID=7769 RepID=UPI00358E2533